MSTGDIRLISNELFGKRARAFQQIHIRVEVGETQQRNSALPRAQQLTWTAQTQVVVRDFEAILILENDLEAFARSLCQRILIQQNTGARRGSTPDASSRPR